MGEVISIASTLQDKRIDRIKERLEKSNRLLLELSKMQEREREING